MELINPQVKRMRKLIIENQKEDMVDHTLIDLYFGYIQENIKRLMYVSEAKRYTKKELEKHIAKFIGAKKFKLQDVSKDGLVCDYAFIGGIFEDFGYLDLYYAKTAMNDDLIVTEISFSQE